MGDIVEEVSLRAQVVACYYMQVALASPGAELPPVEVLARAAGHCALEACSICLPLNDNEMVEARAGLLAHLGDRSSVQPEELPLEHLQRIAVDLPPALLPFADRILKASRRFCADAMMSSHVALELAPAAAAAAAVTLGIRFILGRAGEATFAGPLEAQAGGAEVLRRGVQAVQQVFRLWRDEQLRCAREPDSQQNTTGSNPRADQLSS